MKNPWVVAFLNYLFGGLGTLLLGQRRSAAGWLIVGNLSLRYVDVVRAPAGPLSKAVPQLWPFVVVGMALAGIGCAVDGLREAREG